MQHLPDTVLYLHYQLIKLHSFAFKLGGEQVLVFQTCSLVSMTAVTWTWNQANAP